MAAQARHHMYDELQSQPEVWRSVLDRIDVEALRRPGAAIGLIGCGTSYNISSAWAARREQLGVGVTDAWTASAARLERPYDLVIALSRSGTTSEVVEPVRGCSAPTIAIVGVADTPIAQAADEVIVLTEADEESVVQTRFATAALALLRAAIGEDLEPAIDQATEIVNADDQTLFGDLVEVEQVTFLGRDWAYPLAEEAALKLRESAQFWTEAYFSMEYRHGPISIAQPGRLVWALDELPAGLADEISATGADLIQSTIDPMAELVRIHRFADAVATRRGLDPDQPRSLTRSIILE